MKEEWEIEEEIQRLEQENPNTQIGRVVNREVRNILKWVLGETE